MLGSMIEIQSHNILKIYQYRISNQNLNDFVTIIIYKSNIACFNWTVKFTVLLTVDFKNNRQKSQNNPPPKTVINKTS